MPGNACSSFDGQDVFCPEGLSFEQTFPDCCLMLTGKSRHCRLTAGDTAGFCKSRIWLDVFHASKLMGVPIRQSMGKIIFSTYGQTNRIRHGPR